MALSKDELLKPRYKIIAKYPQCAYNIGRVLTPKYNIGNDKYCNEFDCVEAPSSQTVYNPQNYPHLFKKLEWWEERSLDDMPEYVKDIFRPGMVNCIFLYKVKQHYTRDMTSIDCGVKKDEKYWVDENGFSHLYIHYEPATLEEYTTYLSSLK